VRLIVCRQFITSVSTKQDGLSQSEFINASRDRPDNIVIKSYEGRADDSKDSQDEDRVVSTLSRGRSAGWCRSDFSSELCYKASVCRKYSIIVY
jgi:hypothetical protein